MGSVEARAGAADSVGVGTADVGSTDVGTGAAVAGAMATAGDAAAVIGVEAGVVDDWAASETSSVVVLYRSPEAGDRLPQRLSELGQVLRPPDQQDDDEDDDEDEDEVGPDWHARMVLPSRRWRLEAAEPGHDVGTQIRDVVAALL